MNRPKDRVSNSRRQKSAAAGAAVTAAAFQRLDLGRKNWILFLVGIGSILLGFLLLSRGDITVAPILLVAGYIVFIPWALVARRRTDVGQSGSG